ncbi:haloacid dehalogenase type II [Aestuariivirga litoralis]|uniref:haloacid dehalogenase type II n=1 Tax=Aestuariivirga litoralis TaxID=2650924 RepID=UPI0018C792F3|nr:haloacid dehalogenase type II [Aestuariivirga litoralis]MBG1233147.1 haloacid dehalogenase type II [Aestuariivirga litoralis]
MGETLFKKLEGVQAIVFDAYGTLFDTDGPIRKQASAFGDKLDAANALWTAKQNEYAWVRSLTGVHADYWTVMREALDFTLECLGISEAGLADEVMSAVLKLEPHDGVVAALEALKAKGRRLALLSNGSPSMLDAMLRNAGIDKMFEHAISVEDVGIYKPSRRAYRLAMQKFGIQDAPSICFVSSSGWDAQSAAQFGFQAVRVKRAPTPADRLPGKPAVEIESLGQLLEVL